MEYSQKQPFLLAAAFLLPIVAVLAMNQECIRRQMTLSPNNGRMIYVTADR